MEKQHFFLRLVPPRPSFAYDMTEAERALMLQHVGYMKQHFDQGRVLIYGPVLAKDDSFGMGVLEVADEAEARQVLDGDPTVLAGLNRYEIAPMRVGAARGI
jgi:uncharacterized protein YciI